MKKFLVFVAAADVNKPNQGKQQIIDLSKLKISPFLYLVNIVKLLFQNGI